MSADTYPNRRAGWRLVALLLVAYIFSYTDRVLLSILVEPIKRDLALTDAQIGLLLGPAFALLYATTGVFFGALVDRRRRTWIVGAGIVFWSLATAVFGLVRQFWQLFMTRMCVGVGEASLGPAAMSLIADSFPKESRGKPIAVYSLGIVIGSSIGFLLGAFVLDWTKTATIPPLPIVGDLAPWQLVFVIFGLAGLLPALIFFVIREPRRQLATQSDAAGRSFITVLQFLGAHWKPYALFMTIMCLMVTLAYAGFWNPAMFERTFGWSGEKYALINGIVSLPIGLIVYLGAGAISDRLVQADRHDGPLLLMVLGTLIMVPLYAAAPLMPNGAVAFTVLTAGGLGVMIISAVSVTALLNIIPAHIRGQIVALYYMVMSLFGLFVGPPAVGLLSQHVYGEANLNYALATVPVVLGVVTIVLLPLTLRHYRQQLLVVQQAAQEA
ncbi:MAG: MFS transporter [Pseudomonadota bacterium]